MLDWVPPKKWISFKPELGATPAAAKLAEELVAAGGKNLIDLGQGSERGEMPEVLKRLISGGVKPKPFYHTEAVGPEKTREAAAGWTRRFLRIKEATPENTFVLQQQGRFALRVAFEVAASRFANEDRKVVLMPAFFWPLIEKSYKPLGFRAAFYDITAANLTASIREAADRADSAKIAAIYFNAPQNPTGRHCAAEEYGEVIDYIDSLNDSFGKSRPGILTIHDDPYFAACRLVNPHNPADVRLATGYEGLLKTQLTPKIFIHSWSKVAKAASNSFTTGVIAGDPDGSVFSAFNDVSMTLGGSSYSDSFLENITTLLHGECDIHLRNHIASTGRKYETNRGILGSTFGDAVVPGGSSMTSLVRFREEEILNHEVLCHDHQTRMIRNMDHVVEYVGNQHGVILVNNEALFYPEWQFLRNAQAEMPDIFSIGVSRYKEGQEVINRSPVIEPVFAK